MASPRTSRKWISNTNNMAFEYSKSKHFVCTMSILILIFSFRVSTMVHLLSCVHFYIIYIIRVTIVTESLHESKVLVVTTILLNQQNGVCRWHCTNSDTTVYAWHGISATEGDKQIICTWYFKLLVSTRQNNNVKFGSFTRSSNSIEFLHGSC